MHRLQIHLYHNLFKYRRKLQCVSITHMCLTKPKSANACVNGNSLLDVCTLVISRPSLVPSGTNCVLVMGVQQQCSCIPQILFPKQIILYNILVYDWLIVTYVCDIQKTHYIDLQPVMYTNIVNISLQSIKINMSYQESIIKVT